MKNQYGRRQWIDRAVAAFKERGGKLIVEIGSIRIKGNIDGDGYSTVAWMLAAGTVYSVDINPAATALTVAETKHLGQVRAITANGVQFLRDFPSGQVGKIDLLYLDAWDVGTAQYKEHHLEAFQAALPHLADHALLLIDDMDLDGLGKGELVLPAAEHAGFKTMFLEKQLLMSR